MVSRIDLLESLKKAEVLKEKSQNYQNINSTEMWTTQQQLLSIYEEVLILDLEYALDKKVEQDLWNFCFKNYIAVLQNIAKDNKSGNAAPQAKLAWFLECASGFYLSLLQEICTVFKLDLPFRRCDGVFGVVAGTGRGGLPNGKVNMPKKNSCFYVCQHCLVHLGDIARYRNQMVQAESFYRQGVGLGAGSGHPYNQLALLCRGDTLLTVFYYVRSIAVTHRFPAAVTNLHSTLNKCLQQNNDQKDSNVKMTASDYEALFLRLIGQIYTRKDPSQGTPLLQTLGPALTPLVATHDFSSWKLVQMAVIAVFAYTHSEEGMQQPRRQPTRSSSGGSTPNSISKHSESEIVMAEYLTGFLTALLLPLYTLSADSLLDYYALPAIKTVVSWLTSEPGVIELFSKPYLWRGLSKLLNDLRASHSAPPANCINDALPEDFDLRGFIPLESVISNLNYQGDELDSDAEKRLRAFRLIKAGEWLATQSDSKPIVINDSGLFEVAATPTLSAVVEKVFPLKQPTAVNVGGVSTVPTGPLVQQSQNDIALRQQQSTVPATPRQPHVRQNVALQSILRLSGPQSSSSLMSDGCEWERVASSDNRWWPPRPPIDEVPSWGGGLTADPSANQVEGGGGVYSLFSSNMESTTMLPTMQAATNHQQNLSLHQPMAHQSLWSGPGPSPLERLLEQQKSQRQPDLT